MFGIVAYIFVFLIMEYPYLQRPKIELLTVSIIIALLLLAGVIFPFVGNFAHIGGLIFGFFLSWIVVQYQSLDESTVKFFKNNATTVKQLQDLYNKQKRTLMLKYVMMGISSAVALSLFAVCLIWLYVGQDNWFGFTYFSCIPYTPSFCMDYGQSIQSRNNY